jgi:hypothetical protein
MSVALTIPEEHVAGLACILKLTANDGAAIIYALEGAQSGRVKEMMELILSAVPMEVKSARLIAQTLRSLYNVRGTMDLPVDVFAKEVLAAARKQLPAGAYEASLSEQLLRALLNVRPLSMITKARELHIDHDNIFCTAKVISDMRPVFDVQVDDPPAGFSIVHTMKLGYHQGGKHTELYVAMDKQDIEELIATLQRAQRKAATLAKLCQEKTLPILAD